MRIKHCIRLGLFSIVFLHIWTVTSFAGSESKQFDTVEIKYAKGFSIECYQNHKIVWVRNPWKGSTKVFTYLLKARGSQTPNYPEVDQVVYIPVERIVSLGTSNLPSLESLDLLDKLVAVGDEKLISNREVRKRISERRIKSVGWSANVNLEKLISLSPDLVITFGTGQSGMDRLKEMGDLNIPFVLNGDYMEATPLGRAEWIKFIAAFTHTDELAKAHFDSIELQYKKTIGLISNVKYKPSVFTGSSFNGVWYVPGGNSYFAVFLKDAGAEYLWDDNRSDGSLPLDYESVFSKAYDADIWLNPGSWQSLNDLLRANPKYGLFNTFKDKAVFNNNRRLSPNGGNDFWETGLANPHLVLLDLVKIFHPDLLPDHELIWYRKMN